MTYKINMKITDANGIAKPYLTMVREMGNTASDAIANAKIGWGGNAVIEILNVMEVR